MTVYNVNLGIGWASSCVEYAQAYRRDALEMTDFSAKFIFSDLILQNNIEDLTANLGFADNSIIWLYNFFTDVKIAPSNYPLRSWEDGENMKKRHPQKQQQGKVIRYAFPKENLNIEVRLHDVDKQTIDMVTYFNGQVQIKRDFYSYVKYASEYYSGDAKQNQVTFREFYNEDGSIAYTQHLFADAQEIFEFSNQEIYYSKNDLYEEMIRRLHFKSGDIVILDRSSEDDKLDNGQIIFQHHKPAKLIDVVHADHYDKHFTDDKRILWNNFYEYSFTHSDDVSSYIVATDKQKKIFMQQQKKYYGYEPRVDTIPVGALAKLRKPVEPRKKHSLITASRLASEKHLDWLIKAVVDARKTIKDVTLDIYGQGGEHDRLVELIGRYNAEKYIRLMGQYDLTDIYTKYAAYIAGSTSEGFGLSLMEAVGSGLPMIGFDVPYGNQTFIDNGKNGYLLPYNEEWPDQKKCDNLSKAVIKLFQHDDLSSFENHSYKLAEPYLKENIAKRWEKVLKEISND